MSFNDLPTQSSINERADAYGKTSLQRSAEVAARVRCILNVPYGDDYWQKIDLFLPDGPVSEPMPVLLFFHGGNFTHGYKEWCSFMAPAITSLPAIFVSASYRLLGDAPYPAAIDDSLAAAALVRQMVTQYGGDPERLFIGGHSAGGHIVSLMALRHEWRKTAGLPETAFKAAFPISVTFNKSMAEDGVVGPDAPLELAANAMIPFYITWAENEKQIVRDTSREMTDALSRTGVKVLGEELADRDHFSIHLRTGDPSDQWTRTVREWMTTLR